MEKIKTWQEWLSLCKDAWQTDSPIVHELKVVKGYLLMVDKTPKDSLQKIAGNAWKLYKTKTK